MGPAESSHESVFPPRGHIPVLDGIRGLAILIVIFYHARNAMRPQGAIDEAWSALFSGGWCGVDLFFVLSGFLITGILVDSRDDARCVPRFFARRVLRIFPLYYLYLFAMLVVLPAAGLAPVRLQLLEAYDPWVFCLYLQNMLIPIYGQPGIMGVTWSLAVEEQFYLVWPFVVVWLGRNRLGRTCLALLLVPLFWRFVVAVLEMNPWHAYTPIWARVDSLAAGALVALVVRQTWAQSSAAVLVAAAIWAGSAATVIAIFSVGGTFDFQSPRVFTLGFSAVSLFFAASIFLVMRFRDHFVVRSVFRNQWLRLCGKYSYCMYLAHLSIRQLLVSQLWQGGPPSIFGSQMVAQLLLFAGMTTGSVAIAHLTWRYWESPFLSLKRRLPVTQGEFHRA